MPNIRAAGLDSTKLLELIDSLRELRDPLVDDVVVTQYLHHPCITTPMAQVAASSDTSEVDLAMVLEAVGRCGIHLGENWRYWPLLPRHPVLVAFFYGLEEDQYEAARIAYPFPANAAGIWVPSKVINLRMEPMSYIELRAFPAPVVVNDICAAEIAGQLKDSFDIEIFSQSGKRTPTMIFWPKGATGTSGPA